MFLIVSMGHKVGQHNHKIEDNVFQLATMADYLAYN